MGSVPADKNLTSGMSAGVKLRQLLERDEILIAPGVYEGYSARIAHEVGFDCIYMVPKHSILATCYSDLAC